MIRFGMASYRWLVRAGAGLPVALVWMFVLPAAMAGDLQIADSALDEQGRGVWLVTFEEPGLIEQHRRERGRGERVDPRAPEIMARRARLAAVQAERQGEIESRIDRTLEVSHRYLFTHSGMAVRLTAAEAAELARLDGVTRVERERIYPLATFRGPTFIGAGTVWDGSALSSGTGLRGEGQVVGIIDTGLVDPAAHDAFANDPACGHDGGTPKVISRVDCSESDGQVCTGTHPDDGHGHGTHVAAIVAANTLDESAQPAPDLPEDYPTVSGVAPCARIRAYRACSGESCFGSWLAAALNAVAADGDVDAVNYSISGGLSPWSDLDRLKLDLVDQGIVVSAAAGNTSDLQPDPVGRVNHRGPWVLSVAASSRDTDSAGEPAQGDVLAGFSLRGPTPAPLQDLQKPDITAPGVAIYAAMPGGYGHMWGTSMASPHVAGAALLVRQARPDWTATEIRSALQMTAFNPGTREDGVTHWDADDVGSGRVDVAKAVLAGLVMDEAYSAFVDADPAVGGDVTSLNLPAMRNLTCIGECQFTRTVRNTLEVPANWTLSAEGAPGAFTLGIEPETLEFSGDPAETAVVTVTVTVTPGSGFVDAIDFGRVRFSEDSANSPDLTWTVAAGVPGRVFDDGFE